MLLVKTRLALKCLSMSFVTMANLDGSHLLGCENSVKQLDFCSNIQCVFFVNPSVYRTSIGNCS